MDDVVGEHTLDEVRVPWWRRRGVVTGAAVGGALLLGVGIGGADSGALEEAEARVVELTTAAESQGADLAGVEAERDELAQQLQAALEDLDVAPDVSDLEAEIDRLEDELAEAESRAAAASELEKQESELQARAADLDEREREIAQAAAGPAPAPEADPPSQASESGCAAGQVDINSAGSSDLERIHQVGPARAEQILNLRPFSSVDDLTRVSGIGPAHLSAIKGQGLACVP